MENKFSAIGMILASLLGSLLIASAIVFMGTWALEDMYQSQAPTFGGVFVLLLLFGAVAWTAKKVEVSLK